VNIAFAIVVALLWQSNPKTISFHSAGPAARVIAELGKQNGLAIDVAEPFRREFLVVRVDSAPRKDLLDKIAYAMDGEWIENKSTLVLTRPAQLVQSLFAKEKLNRAVSVKAMQHQIRNRCEALGAFGQTAASGLAGQLITTESDRANRMYPLNMDRISADTPLSRAAMRLFADLNETVVADNLDSERIVFSSRPNERQLALGEKSRQIISEFCEEQRLFAETLQRMGYSKPSRSIFGNSIAISWTRGIDPFKVLLTLERTGRSPLAFTVTLRMADSSGNLVGAATLPLRGSFVREMTATVVTNDSGRQEFHLPGLDAAFVRALDQSRQTGKGVSDPQLRNALLEPVERDPLMFVLPELI